MADESVATFCKRFIMVNLIPSHPNKFIEISEDIGKNNDGYY